MRFVVQYFSRADDRWYRVAAGRRLGLPVGRHGPLQARQFGRSFRIEPPPAGRVLLRGRVYFQWRAASGEVVRRARALHAQGPPLEHRRRSRRLLGGDLHDHVD